MTTCEMHLSSCDRSTCSPEMERVISVLAEQGGSAILAGSGGVVVGASERVAPWNVTARIQFTADLVLDGAVVLESLSEPERQRFFAFRVDEARDDFLAVRSLAKTLLATETGLADVRLSVTQRCPDCGREGHGRPRVLVDGRPARDLSLSWGHAGGVVAVAVARGREVAIDVERFPVGEVSDGLLEAALTPAEIACVVGSNDVGAAMLRFWTLKECVVKLGLDSLDGVAERGLENALSGAGEVLYSTSTHDALGVQVGIIVLAHRGGAGGGAG